MRETNMIIAAADCFYAAKAQALLQGQLVQSMRAKYDEARQAESRALDMLHRAQQDLLVAAYGGE